MSWKKIGKSLKKWTTKPLEAAKNTVKSHTDVLTGIGVQNLAPQAPVPPAYNSPSGTPGFDDIKAVLDQVRALPNPADSVIPQLRALFSQQGEFIKPQLAAMDVETAKNQAKTQSDAMRRGLTGSDIEMANIRGAGEAGTQRKAEFAGQVGMAQTQALASAIERMAMSDYQSQRENLLQLAQLMGQQMTSERDLQMFHAQLQAMIKQGNQAAKTQMWASLIGGASKVGAGFAAGGA